jgi:drug/metabolite transporter (DMT)-like permease
MFLVGTLASVSALIADYPVYGGQAVRYAVAAAILLVVARVLGPAPGRAGTPDRTSGRAQTSGRTEASRRTGASGRTGASRRARASGPAEASSPAGSSGQAEAGGPAEASRRARASGRTEASGRTGARGRVRLGRRELALLGALSATGLVIFNVAVIESARAAGPTLAGTVLGTVPLALALAGGGRPSPRLVFAATVVVAGATLATGLGSGNAAGLAWALVALACEVCFSLLALPLLPRLGAVRVSAYASALAVPLLVAIGLAADGGGFLRVPTAAEALGLGYLSLVITTIAFLLWYTGLPRLGPQRAGLFAGLIPVGAIVTTVVLGLGTPGPADLAGAALVIAGIVMGLYGGVVPSRKT